MSLKKNSFYFVIPCREHIIANGRAPYLSKMIHQNKATNSSLW